MLKILLPHCLILASKVSETFFSEDHLEAAEQRTAQLAVHRSNDRGFPNYRNICGLIIKPGGLDKTSTCDITAHGDAHMTESHASSLDLVQTYHQRGHLFVWCVQLNWLQKIPEFPPPAATSALPVCLPSSLLVKSRVYPFAAVTQH